MRHFLGVLFLIVGAFAIPVSFSGCDNKGPMEEAGEEIDDEIDDATDDR